MATNNREMPRERDTESGKYRTSYPPERFIEAIREAGGMASTRTVADAVGCSYDLAYKRLRAFEDDDRVSSDRIANARLWSVGEGGGSA